MRTPEILSDLVSYLETHRYFQENEESLDNVMLAACDTLAGEETPTDALCAFQKQIIEMFPHPQLPYGEDAPLPALRRACRMTCQDFLNEAHYNVVMAAFMDTTRAHMVNARMPVKELESFEQTGLRMLAS